MFVAGDLLWYPVEGDNVTRAAPDAMVVLGKPKGDRGSDHTYVELATLREQEKQAKEQAQQQLEREKVRSQHLVAKLRELRINPDELL